MVACRYPDRAVSGVSRLRLFAATVTVVIWTAIYGRAAIDPAYHPPAEVSGVMLACATWLYGRPLVEKIKERIGDGPDEPTEHRRTPAPKEAPTEEG